MAPMTVPRFAETPMLAMMRWAMSLLLVGLTVFAALTPHLRGTGALVVVAVTVVGLLGSFLAMLWTNQPAWLWMGPMLLCWVGLLAVSANAAYIAFPLFFLELYLMKNPGGPIAVAVTLVMVVAALSWHQGYFSVGVFLGPTLAAAFAVTVVHSFQVLRHESERRRILLEELESARVHLLTAERKAGQLEERERLAAEIHDTLAQGFTSIQLLLGSAQRLLPADHDLARDLVEQARQTAGDNLNEARGLVAAMAPPDLAHSTLADALTRLAASTTERSGVQVAVAISDGLPPLDVDTQSVLVRVAQSAMANVVQHADASTATISLSAHDGDVRLDLSDDGQGFAIEAVTPDSGRGYGLGMMRRRLDRIGGELSLTSVPRGDQHPGGTTLTATVPVSTR